MSCMIARSWSPCCPRSIDAALQIMCQQTIAMARMAEGAAQQGILPRNTPFESESAAIQQQILATDSPRGWHRMASGGSLTATPRVSRVQALRPSGDPLGMLMATHSAGSNRTSRAQAAAMQQLQQQLAATQDQLEGERQNVATLTTLLAGAGSQPRSSMGSIASQMNLMMPLEGPLVNPMEQERNTQQ